MNKAILALVVVTLIVVAYFYTHSWEGIYVQRAVVPPTSVRGRMTITKAANGYNVLVDDINKIWKGSGGGLFTVSGSDLVGSWNGGVSLRLAINWMRNSISYYEPATATVAKNVYTRA